MNLRSPKAERSKAFTLIELLIATTLFTILLSLTFFRLPFLDRYKVSQEIEHLFVIFSHLQRKAMTTQCVHKLVLREKERSYCYHLHGGKECVHTLSPGVEFGFFPHALGPPAKPVAPLTSALTFESQNNEHVVYFYPQGAISSGAVYLVDTHKTTMKALTCSVAGVSYLRKYHYHHMGWERW